MEAHKTPKRTTLCWSCTKLDCTWMRSLEPVSGWEAEKTEVGHTTKQGFVHLPSYCVKSCPGYTRSKKKEDSLE